MPDSSNLIALRKALAVVAEELSQEAKRQVAEHAIHQILDALKNGVCRLDTWEKRCLAAAIASIRGGRFDQARSMARRALWPEENRRDSAIPRFVLRPGTLSLDELTREFEAARAERQR
jgi:hypothetical protein